MSYAVPHDVGEEVFANVFSLRFSAVCLVCDFASEKLLVSYRTGHARSTNNGAAEDC
jgi:hypothetical protein